MSDTSIHVVPHTPQLGWHQSTPLSTERRFYSVSPSTPLPQRLRRDSEDANRVPSAGGIEPAVPSLTPIPRVHTRRLHRHSGPTDESGYPILNGWTLPRPWRPDINDSPHNVYDYQVVPRTPRANPVTDTEQDDATTRLRDKKTDTPLRENEIKDGNDVTVKSADEYTEDSDGEIFIRDETQTKTDQQNNSDRTPEQLEEDSIFLD